VTPDAFRQADPLTAAPAAHRHAWDAMRFELTDDHAWVVETCATCRLVRRYRAFERFWTPGEDEHRR
jgi:hypothetical protein